ncbi:MAG: bifunctional (p)ppGpp synthetase/guanosine-3',5'-bis(diphosphate) 3'-pyrophosphohydrolase [Bacteriovoracaceae bacterium]|nr:bifunctional (p)ppGpp synthetase/guanosine-3',5'-bis(diphosphate) 3'-pyrophosphohydrolase [Bacteriovoracaceae bacterium]
MFINRSFLLLLIVAHSLFGISSRASCPESVTDLASFAKYGDPQALEEIGKARAFARTFHRATGVKRKFDGTPYFTHPNRVAQTIKELTGDHQLVMVAFLHDVVEDTPATLALITKSFGKRVSQFVAELSSNPSVLAMYKEQFGSLGKARYLTQKMNAMSDQALLIKLADRLDNVSDFTITPPVGPELKHAKFVEKYRKETRFILDNLRGDLSDEHQYLISLIAEKIL